MEKEFLDNIYNLLDNINWNDLEKVIDNRDVYIWGNDEKGKKYEQILAKHNIKIKGYLDSDKTKINSILPNEVIFSDNNKKVFILVSMLLKHKKYILATLRSAGFSTNDYFYPYYEWIFLGGNFTSALSINNSSYKSDSEKGRIIAEGLKHNEIYILITGGHIGDKIVSLSYLYALKKCFYGLKLNIIVEDKFVGLAKLYDEDYDDLIVLDIKKINELEKYTKDLYKEHYNIIGEEWEYMCKDTKVPFALDQIHYKCYRLGLDYDTKSKYVTKSYKESIEFKKYVKEKSLARGKSIIFVPYAQSARELPISFWERLAQEFGDKYELYTNVIEGQNAIKGTVPIEIPFEYLIDVVNYAGKAISIRCGIADILALGKCNCDVLYAYENSFDLNYARVNSTYINGDESILFKNAIYIDVNKIDDEVYSQILIRN